jgi:hypothetical protein
MLRLARAFAGHLPGRETRGGLGVELWVGSDCTAGIHTARGFPGEVCLTLSPPGNPYKSMPSDGLWSCATCDALNFAAGVHEPISRRHDLSFARF